MLHIIGNHFHRLWHGDPERAGLLRAEQAAIAAANPYPTLNIDRQTDSTKPYNGISFPMGASLSLGADFLGEWDDNWHIVPAKNNQDMLVFADTFVAETRTSDVIYDDEDARRVDEYDFPLRLAETIAIPKRLEEGGERCKRVVRYLGSTPSCYRIENRHPTKSECMIPRDILARHDDWTPEALLALHQRWALQYVSACRHVHAKGIVIISAPAECTWLRPDSSLVVVPLVAASCREIGVSAGDWSQYHSYPDSPFRPGRSRSIDPPYGVDE
jgi:hypothetical protein